MKNLLFLLNSTLNTLKDNRLVYQGGESPNPAEKKAPTMDFAAEGTEAEKKAMEAQEGPAALEELMKPNPQSKQETAAEAEADVAITGGQAKIEKMATKKEAPQNVKAMGAAAKETANEFVGKSREQLTQYLMAAKDKADFNKRAENLATSLLTREVMRGTSGQFSLRSFTDVGYALNELKSPRSGDIPMLIWHAANEWAKAQPKSWGEFLRGGDAMAFANKASRSAIEGAQDNVTNAKMFQGATTPRPMEEEGTGVAKK